MSSTMTASEGNASSQRPPRLVPGSTYRLQMNPDFTFAQAQAILPYLERLGVTHLYLSPFLSAHPGSAHGYDLTDHNTINPDLGGAAGFEALSDAARARGRGILVDFVPNHMGVDQPRLNHWWWDVLENGMSSPYGRFFDIDWNPVKTELRGKVLLPVLGDQYGNVLERGELTLAYQDGALSLHYFEREFPINPRVSPRVYRHGIQELTEALGAEHPDTLEFLSIQTALDNLPTRLDVAPTRIAVRQREKEVARERMARLTERSAEIRRHVAACVRHFNADPAGPGGFDALHELLEGQAYRLAYWRTAFHEINYRRFFDVNGLASLRMESPEVFEIAHGLLFELVAQGRLSGVRLDHVDGLNDPDTYLGRLADALATARRRGRDADPDRAEQPDGDGDPVYVVVEKILSPGEPLPAWPVHGTTGYEFLNVVNGLFVDPQGRRPLQRIYRRFTGEVAAFEDIVVDSKKTVMESTLASEVNMLAHALNRISEDDPRSRDFTLNSLREMLVEVIACLPVYRTYVNAAGWSEGDRRVVEEAVGEARLRNPWMDESIFAFLVDVLFDRDVEGRPDEVRARRRAFALSLQQYTGPVQAKGVEDTTFYRYNVLVSLNEVGGAPERFARPPEEFHALNLERRSRWPDTMSCTATHDTKRGEDMRTRIDVLSELADEWGRLVSRWARTNASNRTRVSGRWAPDRNDEYFFYQTLVGAWPQNRDTPGDLVERLPAYLIKAIREAKRHTSWINEHQPYEQAMTAFAVKCLSGRRAPAFLEAFLPFQRRVARIGAIHSLAQVVLKITAPGVPDFYQGTELWDLSLVDPDNRRPVDFERRAELLESIAPLLDEGAPPAGRGATLRDLLHDWEDGRIKLAVTALALRLRATQAGVFEDGDYVPLEAAGAHAARVVAFARTLDDDAVIVVAPRLVARMAEGAVPLGEPAWEDTRIELPAELTGTRWISAMTGERIDAESGTGVASLPLARLFQWCPVALLRRADGRG